jgi:hypothetical protein
MTATTSSTSTAIAVAEPVPAVRAEVAQGGVDRRRPTAAGHAGRAVDVL